MYTVKQLSELAGVSVRTLHHYDAIQVLTPSKVGANGYRYYDDSAVLRLQQILFYRELGFELGHIKDILDAPNFDVLSSLESHRSAILAQRDRLHHLLSTIDQTIQHVKGDTTMSKKRLFEGFSEEKQKDYEREIRLEYGPDKVNESVQRWGSYTPAQRDAIMAEGKQIYSEIVEALTLGKPANSADVRAILDRWQGHIRHFYEPSLEILRGLGEMYNTHPDFIANFQQLHPDLPRYLQNIITVYVDTLETAEIERLLAADQDALKRLSLG